MNLPPDVLDALERMRAEGRVVERRTGAAPTPPPATTGGADAHAAFLASVIDLAHQHGWVAASFRPGRTVKGWRTPCQADSKGFPDLLLLHPATERLLVAEVKTGTGRLTPEQKAWLGFFQAVGVPAYCWRPTDWSGIVRLLASEEGE